MRSLLGCVLSIFVAACGGGGGGGSSANSTPAGSSSSSSATLVVAGNTGLLNDSGLEAGGYDLSGAYVTPCGSAVAGSDCKVGRDATANDNSDGKAGFSFTKIDSNGYALSASAASWACVKDNVTGLIWENKTSSNGSLTYTNLGGGGSGDASQYVNSTNATGLCGAKDWRLPSSDELQGLIDYSNGTGTVMIDTAWFPNTQAARYWSATAYVAGSSGGPMSWFVEFNSGYMYAHDNTTAYGVRLVRSSSASSATRYTISGDGLEVTDNRTGLIWRRCAEGMSWNGSTCVGAATTYSVVTAFARANSEATSTGKAWRIPNIKELVSTIDKSRSLPAVDSTVFPVTPQGLWSSSPDLSDTGYTWQAITDIGRIDSYPVGSIPSAGAIRLVR